MTRQLVCGRSWSSFGSNTRIDCLRRPMPGSRGKRREQSERPHCPDCGLSDRSLPVEVRLGPVRVVRSARSRQAGVLPVPGFLESLSVADVLQRYGYEVVDPAPLREAIASGLQPDTL